MTDTRPPAVRLAEAIAPFMADATDGESADTIAAALVAAGWMQIEDFLGRLRALLDADDVEDETDFDDDSRVLAIRCDRCQVAEHRVRVTAPDASSAYAAAAASARAAGWTVAGPGDYCPACAQATAAGAS